jgi:hypothetical protein
MSKKAVYKTFDEWLRKRKHLDLGVNDLALDVKYDPEWPSQARSYKAFRGHLEACKACGSALDALSQAWKEWKEYRDQAKAQGSGSADQ